MAKVSIKYDDKRLRRNARNFNRNFRRNISAMWIVVRRSRQAILKRVHVGQIELAPHERDFLPFRFMEKHYEEIYMAYSVTYGIWLETANDRQYAIITPMMRIAGEALIA